jgi:hypothetical protein
MKLIFLIFLLLALPYNLLASHIMGGEITWRCQGGNYVFELVVYRDCNGAEVNTISENIKVWNHASISNIVVQFLSRTDISPTCTQVSGSPSPLACGTGPNAGNGIGAIEQIIYQSDPITLLGIPPASGWIFTYADFARSSAITNLSNPSTYGITLTAKMFANPVSTGLCIDNSPYFMQSPYMVTCAGSPYTYNANAIDPDLDSIHVEFGTPMNNFSGTYNPPVSPNPIPFVNGFSTANPTPDASMNGSNIASSINSNTGELTFTSYTSGNFVVKLLIKSFRNGILIAEIEREMQLIVMNCSSDNTTPTIAGPFGGLFETTVTAGALVNFNLSSTDNELLQDGSPQNNILTATGPMFGTNLTSTSGCDIAPCATLDAPIPIVGSQGVNTTFNWQTDCDHLVNPYGEASEIVPYNFVFKVQDNFCQIPKISYATITINVLNPGIIQAPSLDCIQGDENGDFTISWNPVSDPNSTFTAYEVHSIQSGLITTINSINTSSYIHSGATTSEDYFLKVVSGCNGNTFKSSDTLASIFLSLTNPSNGTAVLQWNKPAAVPTASMNSYYHIMREYPTGTWTLLDSVPFSNGYYIDTIDICDAFLNYQIILPNIPCDFSSNIAGDNFEDLINPDIPIITNVSIDTITNAVTLNWNQNGQNDTYGYIIYIADENGFLSEIDTVWGLTSTTYSYNTDITQGPLTYSVSAFDSCLTLGNPPTYQTSAKGDLHTSMFLTANLLTCDNQIYLEWTPYGGWDSDINYYVYGHTTGNNWEILDTSGTTNSTLDVTPLTNYCFVIQAENEAGTTSFSSPLCIYIKAPSQPAYNYLSVATVDNNEIELRHYIEAIGGVSEVSFQKLDTYGDFNEIGKLPVTNSNVSFIDENVYPSDSTYTYQVQVIDSCGNESLISNEATTILLKTSVDNEKKVINLNWTPYQGFKGTILGYNIYRGIDGVFNSSPLETVSTNQLFYTDELEGVVSTGKICYYVEAIESMNIYAFQEISRSNESCGILKPLIFIPNAFTPDGANPKFLPIVTFVEYTTYELIIYNHWNHPLYKTNDPLEGWNGSILNTGKIAQDGVYIYTLKLTDGAGQEIVKQGHVVLIR